MSDLPILIRPLRDADHPLILDSWVNSIRYSSPAFFWVPSRICKTIYRRMLVRLLESRGALFRVLVNEENEDQIFAWICGDARVTHFVYVKEDFREEGLASLLIDVKRKAKGWVFSHWTRDCERIGRIEYRPSLFQEVIRGIDQSVGDSSPKTDKHTGKTSPYTAGREPGPPEMQPAGV